MRFNSVTFKLLGVIIVAFIIAVICGVVLAILFGGPSFWITVIAVVLFLFLARILRRRL